jgi:hypothetical protein
MAGRLIRTARPRCPVSSRRLSLRASRFSWLEAQVTDRTLSLHRHILRKLKYFRLKPKASPFLADCGRQPIRGIKIISKTDRQAPFQEK